MNEALISSEPNLSHEERRFIINSLVGFNDAEAPAEDYRDLAIVARHNGKLVGGLLAHTHWNWLFIKQLWVDESFRNHGLGRSLMFAVEREACNRSCIHSYCDTFDFQALAFYQKLGYTVFGSLDDFPTGHVRYFLQKRNLGGRS